MTTDTQPGDRPWYRDRWLAAAGTFAVLAVTVLGGDLLPRPLLGPVGWTTLSLLETGAAALCWAIAGAPALTRRLGRLWRLAGLAPVLFAVGSALQAVLAVLAPGSRAVFTGAPLQAVLASAGAVLLITALLTWPVRLATHRERRRFWLDAATVMIFFGVVAWLLADPDTGRGHSPSVATLLNTVVAPAVFVAVVFGVVRIVLGGESPVTRSAGAFGCLAAGLQVANTGLAETLLAHGHPAWKLAIGTVADLSFLTCLRIQQLQVRQRHHLPVRERHLSRHSLLPYLSLAASYGLLVVVLGEHRLGVEEWVVLLGAIAGSGTVVMRQLAAFADNRDLLAERDALAERLRHLAYHDHLTGLANRSLFMERLTAALAPGTGDALPTVVILDLDGFKPVNDRYGHQAGDALLVAVAERMRRSVRPEDMVARLGGDEFAILMCVSRPVEVSALVRRVAAAVCEPVGIGQDSVTVRASIGSATATGQDDTSTLLHRADLEMYAAKQLNRDAVELSGSGGGHRPA